MDLTRIALFDLADKRLAWVDKRQELLAQNVANANTPGWRSRDLTPFAAQLTQAEAAPVQTNPMHLPGAAGSSPNARPVPGQRAPDGNAVSLDVELTRIADTETTQALVGDLYKKYLGFFRTALGR
ncbi:flagellar biosynthesis protein FlgB [Rhodovastum sp. RN2-1]|uniref:Flagellar basal body rod protein FlgB n=2 Tax=Limobrevibacterium gyesilva TaxID=2991712 RepID=A0AA42CHP6_9PROT|nr:flagellar biosynthesis protein FlgB [Limobrevibacterium gyesilva]